MPPSGFAESDAVNVWIEYDMTGTARSNPGSAPLLEDYGRTRPRN